MAATPFTNLVDDKGETVNPTAAWPDFRKEVDKVQAAIKKQEDAVAALDGKHAEVVEGIKKLEEEAYAVMQEYER